MRKQIAGALVAFLARKARQKKSRSPENASFYAGFSLKAGKMPPDLKSASAVSGERCILIYSDRRSGKPPEAKYK
jgi:hypothetical protein